MAKHANNQTPITIPKSSLSNIQFLAYSNTTEINSNLRQFIKIQTQNRHKLNWQNHPSIINKISEITQHIDWNMTITIWNWNGKITSGYTSSKSARMRTFLLRSFHENLPTANYLFSLWPQLYKTNICKNCFQNPETTQHFWMCPAITNQKELITTQIKQQWIKIINSHLTKIMKPIIFTDQASDIFDSEAQNLLLQGIVSKNLVQQHSHLGISSKEISKIIVKIGKQAVQLAYENLWKTRCKTQIQWERKQNITTIQKSYTQKRAKSYNSKISHTRISTPSSSSIIIDNGHKCICEIPTQLHYSQSCNNKNRNNYFADKHTNLEYIGYKWDEKVISIIM